MLSPISWWDSPVVRERKHTPKIGYIMLSREEEVELARSNKKIKKVHHSSSFDGVNVG